MLIFPILRATQAPVWMTKRALAEYQAGRPARAVVWAAESCISGAKRRLLGSKPCGGIRPRRGASSRSSRRSSATSRRFVSVSGSSHLPRPRTCPVRSWATSSGASVSSSGAGPAAARDQWRKSVALNVDTLYARRAYGVSLRAKALFRQCRTSTAAPHRTPGRHRPAARSPSDVRQTG